MKKKKRLLLLPLILILSQLFSMVSFAEVTSEYRNPLMKGADPTIARDDDGYYYSCFGTDNNIYLKKSDSVLGISTSESRLVWEKPEDFGYVWGPYIYRIDGNWYIYFASGPEGDVTVSGGDIVTNGDAVSGGDVWNVGQFGWGHPSSYVLENTSPDPFEGEWVLKGSSSNQDYDGSYSEKAGLLNTDGYGLACGVITIAGEQYFTYSKYEYYTDHFFDLEDCEYNANEPNRLEYPSYKFAECPTIVKMENPWTLDKTIPECTIARPEHDWEKHGDNVNEGCALVERDGTVWFGYSASSFMNDNYAVAMSHAKTVIDGRTVTPEELMQESAWTKDPVPALSKSDENVSYGTGSPLFVKSEDGSEDWLIYHAGPVGGQTGSDRWVRAQRVNWNDDGTINLGIPSNPDTVYDRPSGEIKYETYEAEDAAYANVTRKIISDSARSSGSGNMQYTEDNGYIEFTVDADKAGTYALQLRYNNISGSEVPLTLTVNGGSERTLSFKDNGPYAVNFDLLDVYGVELAEGENKIRLSNSAANDLVLDAMVITRTVLYEAEDADLDGVGVATDHVGYSGSGFVGGFDGDGNKITFTVEAPYSGNYSLNLRYCRGFNDDSSLTLYVNDKEIKKSTLFCTRGNWDKWSERIDNVELKAGTNTVTFKRNSGDKGGVNIDCLTVTEAVTRHYEAEYANHVGGAYAASGNPNYTGNGYVEGLWTGGAGVDFNVEIENAGKYDVKVRYAMGFAGETKSMGLYVNGERVTQVEMGYTGGWNQWDEALVTLDLEQGNNVISYIYSPEDGDGGNVNIDSLHLNRRTEWKYQAEREGGVLFGAPVLTGNLGKATDHLWFEGIGFIGGFDSVGDAIEFEVNVPNTAEYTASLRYSGAHDRDNTITMYVNGEKFKQLVMPRTANWDTWEYATETVKLNAGKNSIKFVHEDGDTGGFNIDSLTIDKGVNVNNGLKDAGVVSGTVYAINNKNSGQTVDIDGYSSAVGANIHQWPYSGGINERWEIIDLNNGYYKIKSRFSGHMLDAGDDMNVFVGAADSNRDAQQWGLEKVGSFYKLVNKQYGKVLEVVNGSRKDGDNIILGDDVDADYQLWSIGTPGSLHPHSEEDHMYNEWKSDGEDTHTATCVCGAVSTEEHQWDEGSIVKEPTVEEKGEKSYQCEKCDATKTEELDKLPEQKPDDTPEQKPDDTPEQKPDDTPEQKPDDTPEQKPDETPEQKPDDTPEQKPDDTPEQKPDDTPEQKPDETPEQKPDETPEQKPDDTYAITEGANGGWQDNAEEGYRIVCNGDFAKFTGIKVDGKLVDASNYTAVSGSTIITLKPEYMDTLAKGEHTIDLLYTDGVVSTKFEVQEKQEQKPTKKPSTPSTSDETKDSETVNSPKTGDNAFVIWALVILAIGAVVVGSVKTYRLKKEDENS